MSSEHHIELAVEDLERMKINAEMRLAHAMSIDSEAGMEMERRQLALIAMARKGVVQDGK